MPTGNSSYETEPITHFQEFCSKPGARDLTNETAKAQDCKDQAVHLSLSE